MEKVTLMELIERLVEKHGGNKTEASRAIGAGKNWAFGQIKRQARQVRNSGYLTRLADELGLQWHEVEHLAFGYQPTADEVEAEAQAEREAIAAAFRDAPQGTTHRLNGEPVRIVRLAGKERYFRWVNGQWVQSTWVEQNRRFLGLYEQAG